MTDPQAPEDLAAVFRDDERLQPLIGPGGPFEVEAIVLDGVPLRVFVRAPRTVLDAFDLGVAHAERTQIVHEDERLTFAEVRARSLALARELQSSFGVRPGDRVAIAMRNLPEFVISFWGAALVGAIVVPLNSWWQGPELTYALQDAGAVVAFVDEERRDRVVSDGRPADLQLVTVRTAGGDETRFDELAFGAPLEESAIARPDPDDPVTILYTSGTTGRPKGALGTHRGAIANIWNMAFGAARESLIAGRRPDPSVQPASLSAAAPVPHRRRGRHHREPDRRLEDRAHAQVGRRRGAPVGRPRAPHGTRRRARHRPPDPRAPGRRAARPGDPYLPAGRRRRAPGSPQARGAGVRPGRAAPQRLRDDRDDVGRGHQRGRGVRGPSRQRGAAQPDRRPAGGGPGRERTGRGRGGRALLPVATGGQGLLERRGVDACVVRSRMVPLRRPRLRRRRRVRVRGRPVEGRRDPGRGERLLRRGRGRAPRAPRRGRRRRRRPRGADDGGARVRGRRAPGRRRGDPARPAGVRLDAAGRVQVPRGAAPHPRAAPHGDGEGGQAGAARTRSAAADLDTLW